MMLMRKKCKKYYHLLTISRQVSAFCEKMLAGRKSLKYAGSVLFLRRKLMYKCDLFSICLWNRSFGIILIAQSFSAVTVSPGLFPFFAGLSLAAVSKVWWIGGALNAVHADVQRDDSWRRHGLGVFRWRHDPLDEGKICERRRQTQTLPRTKCTACSSEKKPEKCKDSFVVVILNWRWESINCSCSNRTALCCINYLASLPLFFHFGSINMKLTAFYDNWCSQMECWTQWIWSRVHPDWAWNEQRTVSIWSDFHPIWTSHRNMPSTGTNLVTWFTGGMRSQWVWAKYNCFLSIVQVV